MPTASADISMREGCGSSGGERLLARMRKGRVVGLLACLLILNACAPKPGAAFDQDTIEPRAFGWHLGDRLSRTVHVAVPAGWVLDPASLPRAGKQGGAVEFARVARLAPGGAESDVWQLGLQVDYQIMQSPDAPRSIDLPGFAIRFDPAVGAAPSGPAAVSGAGLTKTEDAAVAASAAPTVTQPVYRELRIPAYAVIVTPLVGQPTPTGRSWGEMRPDMPAPLVSSARQSWGFRIGAGLFGFGLLGLLLRPLFDAWWSRRQLPMAHALRRLREATQALNDATCVADAMRDGGEIAGNLREAFRRVHAGLDAWAGRVFVQADVADTLRQFPSYAGTEVPVEAFFAASQLLFYGASSDVRMRGAGAAPGDYRVADLKALMTQLAAAERAEWGRNPGTPAAAQSRAVARVGQS